MAILQLTHAPILNSNAQVMILPVNSAGMLLDPVLMRSKTLYPDNYQRYRRACVDGSIRVGGCLLHKRQKEYTGLSVSPNSNQPNYIANLVVSNHPYHPVRTHWLTTALTDFCNQLQPLIRYQGIRRIALLARPLLVMSPPRADTRASTTTNLIDNNTSSAHFSPLDWHADILPLLTEQLQHLPKVRIDLHLPKTITIETSFTL